MAIFQIAGKPATREQALRVFARHAKQTFPLNAGTGFYASRFFHRAESEPGWLGDIIRESMLEGFQIRIELSHAEETASR